MQPEKSSELLLILEFMCSVHILGFFLKRMICPFLAGMLPGPDELRLSFLGNSFVEEEKGEAWEMTYKNRNNS